MIERESHSTAGSAGQQTRPFILHPGDLDVPDAPIVGAATVHGILLGWRRELNGASSAG